MPFNDELQEVPDFFSAAEEMTRPVDVVRHEANSELGESTFFRLTFDHAVPAEKAAAFLVELSAAVRQKGGRLCVET